MQPSDSEHPPKRLTWLANIYRTYTPDLQRFVYSKVGEMALAEDLTSMVFLKALRWLREDQSVESVRGWLYATARTTIADHWQAQGQYEARFLFELDEQLPSYPAGASIAQKQAELHVQRLLSLLPERERNVLSLRYLQGYSTAEIAEVLGTNAGHIRVLQLRALRRAAQLERRERNVYIMQEQESPFDSVVPLLNQESLRVLDQARAEALTLKHHWIGTEHLLWGLVSAGSLASFFTPLGITPERIHAGVVFIFDRQMPKNLPETQETPSVSASAETLAMLTPRAKKAIVLARDEMKSQGEQSIRPTHLLLGLLNEGEGIGAGLLRSLGISLLQARAALSLPAANSICSFCGRSGSQVKRIFTAETGATPSAQICDQCVERFHTMLGNPGE